MEGRSIFKMPPIESSEDAKDDDGPKSVHHKVRDMFAVPPPVKKLFDKFPFITYPPNEVPQRAPSARELPALYIFTTALDARHKAPSFNPSCLKWQAYLKFAHIDFVTVPSNNHASPTGALPFLLPSKRTSPAPLDSPLPIPSNKVQKWAREQGSTIKEPSDMKYDAYLSLLEHRIRHAWLYTFYLEPANFTNMAEPLYINPTTSSSLIRATLAHQLRAAATAELLKYCAIIDADDLYSEADKAFDALSVLLGDDEWFFGGEGPGFFDASVFAYTHLLLDEGMQWKINRLKRGLRGEGGRNLIQHERRVTEKFFGR
ncbi:MAG: hypothetical protein M1827_004433 [Pycnora praestabilis]|nr:MAG: hypothetical protein M1827_004433 [Pycnora praestabilis]